MPYKTCKKCTRLKPAYLFNSKCCRVCSKHKKKKRILLLTIKRGIFKISPTIIDGKQYRRNVNNNKRHLKSN